MRIGFGIILGGLALFASAFYSLQNSGVFPGGQVAAIKLAWLMCAILFWYLLPGLMLLDGRLQPAVRRALLVLLASMMVRGVVELIMMYVSNNWHPWIGIGHDSFMFLLMLVIAMRVFPGADRLYAGFLAVATMMFVPEAGFAWYMLVNASDPGSVVYFVPDDPEHGRIMIVTAACVATLMVYLVFFTRQWLYGSTKR